VVVGVVVAGSVAGFLAGVTGHTPATSRAATVRAATTAPSTVADCVPVWNSSASVAVRLATKPGTEPFGPFPVTDVGAQPTPTTSLQGAYSVHVGISQAFGSELGPPGPRCYVYFYFSTGYQGGPALLSFPLLASPTAAYSVASATVTTGADTDVSSAATATQNPDGTLTLNAGWQAS